MPDHRVPPKPPAYDLAQPGTCRFCGQPTAGKATWHKGCVDDYALIFWPDSTRSAVLRRDGHLCQECGAPGYEADHIIPLAEALPAGDDPWWQWRLANLQTLCTACHQRKTAEMAARWARWRRAYLAQSAGQGGLFGRAA